jgi:hypothetical protein
MNDTENRSISGGCPRRHPTEPDESDDSIIPLTPAQFMEVSLWFAREILARANEVAEDVLEDSEPPVADKGEPTN